MKSVLLLSLMCVLSLNACGPDDSAAEAAAKEKQRQDMEDIKNNTKPEDGKDPKENVIEYHKEGEQMALAIEDTRDLPECKLANNKQLVYVKNADQFLSCEKTVWTHVPMKSGAQGVAGATGSKGDKGDKGEPGEVASGNNWYDSVSQKRWFVGADADYTHVETTPACTGGWRHPTATETIAAISRGLMVGRSGTYVWTSELASVSPSTNAIAVLISSITATARGKSFAYTIACISVN